jgi:60 kDa SS-A/Ro ribonucleoprotein
MRTNVARQVTPVFTHENGRATPTDAFNQLRRTVLTCMLFESTFYEKGNDIAQRIAELVPKVSPANVASLAIEARNEMQLRHAPLFLLRELARVRGAGSYVELGLDAVIQRADELAEFLAIYWKNGREPISAAAKRGLASAFQKFDAYQLAKYNRDNAIKLRDVMRLVHPRPKSHEQAALWKLLVKDELPAPDTWEVALSAGQNKKETFERLMSEGKLGGLAVLRNLRLMKQAGVDDGMIRRRLSQGLKRVLPFRFLTAARYNPELEDALEEAMFAGLVGVETLPGKTGLLIDVSGSMEDPLSEKGETTRLDAAMGLAILIREKAQQGLIATFSNLTVKVPPRRGFALRDAINRSQAHNGTWLRKSLEHLQNFEPEWKNLDRIIVITDEQSVDGIAPAHIKNRSYVVNVAPNENGVSYRNGWTHIDGWSERVLDYILEVEKDNVAPAN